MSIENNMRRRSPKLLAKLKSKNVVCTPNYNVIYSYLPFSFFHFSMTTLLQLGVYTWFFENRVNESFIFFEVVLILRLALKDTVSKLRSKEVFLFRVGSVSSPSAATCSVKKRGKKNKCKRKETPK